ncbi:ABC transporter permease [Mucilaginibacter myungsuensis]|uniref:ABC transporter permease n=1 Tax=Mucilaginibacter myungsuensis TaxID=649104 RepID=A0A929KZF2_9SPHI|nr:ABC transporter permease [Mucilaginibacter myungsuensis]MBE9664017.1 ABC transporter permease [Mucilaginibacter myungsuensis]MDN3601196.1 ABC transporter permease [Mucilaginibacter myungsuensis]
MNTSLYIAKRYLFSHKKMHAINIISGISMLGVFVGSAALFIILSGFNGLEGVVLSLYSNFTPEIRIEPAKGKTFDPNTPYFKALRKDARVFSFTDVLQDKVLIRYNDRPFIATIEGVSDEFLNNKGLDSLTENGSFTLHAKGADQAVIGATVQNSLAVSIKDPFGNQIEVWTPRRKAVTSFNPLDDFNHLSIPVSGVFSVQQDFDGIVVTPIAFTRELLDEPVNVSALNINFKKGTDLPPVLTEIKEKAGSNYIVKDRYQQNENLYKILNNEGLSVYMILTFVVIIAIFNIIGSLTMLVMDKQKDIAILTGLGAGKRIIQGIFFYEGMMISGIGCVSGLVAGLIFCILQKVYGFIKMGSALTVMDAYPVEIHPLDILVVLGTVMTIAVIASAISARLSVKTLGEIKNEL